MSDPFALDRLAQARAELVDALLDRSIAKLSLALKLWNPDQPRVPAGSSDGGQWVGDNGRAIRYAENLTSGRTQSDASARIWAVPFVDRTGRPVLNNDGQPMLRSDALPPEFFMRRGQEAAQRIRDARRVSDPLGPDASFELSVLFSDLAKFGHNGPWDAQRIDGVFHPELRDYATVAIGIYGASAGILQDTMLSIQNLYAWRNSSFSRGEEMDAAYRYLPKKNVFNTALGYDLVANGRISLGRSR